MSMYIKQLTHLNWTMEPQVQIGDILCTYWGEVGEVGEVYKVHSHTRSCKTHPNAPFLQLFVNIALKTTLTMIDTHKYDK